MLCFAGVVQWQNDSFPSCMSWVRFPSPAPDFLTIGCAWRRLAELGKGTEREISGAKRTLGDKKSRESPEPYSTDGPGPCALGLSLKWNRSPPVRNLQQGASGQTRMIEVVTVDAVSTIRLLESIAALYPMLALIHVFLDNARYHHAKLVQEWLARPGCRIKLHFTPSYCPHLNPIERLWGLMHRNVTHNKCYATCAQFADATLGFLRETVPRNWADLCDLVTDNFRVINPKDFP